MNAHDILDEIETLTRDELVAAKNELTADKDIPRKEKGQIMAQIDARLSALKKKKEPIGQNGGHFYSFIGGVFHACQSDNSSFAPNQKL